MERVADIGEHLCKLAQVGCLSLDALGYPYGHREKLTILARSAFLSLKTVKDYRNINSAQSPPEGIYLVRFWSGFALHFWSVYPFLVTLLQLPPTKLGLADKLADCVLNLSWTVFTISEVAVEVREYPKRRPEGYSKVCLGTAIAHLSFAIVEIYLVPNQIVDWRMRACVGALSGGLGV